MECREAAQLQAYHDGRLSVVERVRIEAHLHHCEACRRLLEQMRALSLLIVNSPMAVMPQEAIDRLREDWDVVQSKALGERMVQEREVRDRGVLRIAGWLTAAAAALLMGGLLTLSPWQRPTETFTSSPGQAVAWEPAAIMPPSGGSEGTPELLQIAQWIAEDLSGSPDQPGGVER